MALLDAGGAAPVNAVDDRGRTALWYAADRGNGAAVRALLGKGPRPKLPTSKGARVPAPAAGARKRGKRGSPAAFGKGAERDRRSSAGNTALMLASQGGLLEVVRALSARGASADLRNQQGDTALMLASAAGHGEIVKARLEVGADRGLRNKRRQTPVDIATASGHSAVVELLK
jgi:uncharacterized protein